MQLVAYEAVFHPNSVLLIKSCTCQYNLCSWHVSLIWFQAYTDELVELHRRLMALRERNVLQQVGVLRTNENSFCVWVNALKQTPVSRLQIVNLIEETGHFNVTNTTFDFDLFSLDESTVRKLQSYLEATTTWQDVPTRLPFFSCKWKVKSTVFWGGSAAMWRLDCKPTLQHLNSLSSSTSCSLRYGARTASLNQPENKTKASLCSHNALMHQGLRVLYFIFLPMFFQGIFDWLWWEKKGSPARHECIAFYPLGLVLVPFSHFISFVLLGTTAVLSFTFCTRGTFPGSFANYVSILIYVFAKRALELKCRALLVQLVKVFGKKRVDLCVFCHHVWFGLAGEVKGKEKASCFSSRRSVDSLCFWLPFSRSGVTRLHLCAPSVHSYANSFKRLRGLSCRPHALNFTLPAVWERVFNLQAIRLNPIEQKGLCRCAVFHW